MSEWEPATDAEVAMRDALRTDDQESYFRILSGVDLLLPVSADALAGLAPLGWGTWSTGGRTHVLAFTSTASLQSCLADYTGSARRVPYAELANTWPNLEWWLAVNPGLPVEGYLPAWFVAQLSRGDLRLPTRGPGRTESVPVSNKIQDLQAAALAANAVAAQQDEPARPGGPTHENAPLTAATGSYPQYPAATYGQPAAQQSSPVATPPAAYGQAAANTYGGAYAQTADAQPGEVPSLPTRTPSNAYGQPGAAAPASAPPASPAPASAPPAPSHPASAPPAYGQPASVPPAYGQPANVPPAYGQPASVPAAYGQPASVPPAYGEPASVPAGYGEPAGVPNAYSPGAYARPASAPPASDHPTSAPPAFGQPGFGQPADHGRPASAPPAYGRPAEQPPARPGDFGQAPAEETSAPKPEQTGPGGLPLRTPSGVLPSGLPARTPSAASAGGLAAPAVTPAPAVPTGYQPPAVPPMSARPSAPVEEPRGPGQNPSGPLPVRTPMAQTPPVPENFAPHNPDETPFNPGWTAPSGTNSALGNLPRRQPGGTDRQVGSGGGFPQGPASPLAAAAQRPAPPAMPPISAPPAPASAPAALSQSPSAPFQAAAPPAAAPATQATPAIPAEPSPGFGTPLPRRQATSASESPGLTSFPAFQTRSSAAPAAAPGAMIPPVIPGSPGSDRPARLGAHPPIDVHGGSAAPSRPQPEPAKPAIDESFVPANDVERELFDAAGGYSTDAFLSTLLLATVLVPVANHSRPGSAPGESGFAFRTEDMDGEHFLIVFTSKDRLAEHYAEPTRTVGVRFYELIRNWPDPAWSFAVNPNSPIGAKYPGPQVIALANWAAEAGLGADPDGPLEDVAPVPPPEPASDDAQHATVMQKTLPPEQVDYYLERGYDRVAGFVHRATEVEHLRTPSELFGALGLSYDTSPHQADAKEAYVLRWPAYRPSLYRIPYGGQNEQALRAMDGWVIERGPFRGNGFAPGEGRDVIAEFKVDSVRLPHGAQLWRIDTDGTERMVAIFDNDGPLWRRVGEQ